MRNKEIAELFKTIADSFMALSEIYSSATEETEQPKATGKKEKPVKISEPDDVLHIIDFKYGLGVLVEAEHNPQMMCYALGALDIYDGIYDIKTVKMTIFQPRRDNVSTCTMDKETLLTWADPMPQTSGKHSKHTTKEMLKLK